MRERQPVRRTCAEAARVAASKKDVFLGEESTILTGQRAGNRIIIQHCEWWRGMRARSTRWPVAEEVAWAAMFYAAGRQSKVAGALGGPAGRG